MEAQPQERIGMLVQLVGEAIDAVPAGEWRALVERAFANQDVEEVLWPGRPIPDHADLQTAMDNYREWKRMVGSAAITDGTAFGRGFWTQLADTPASLLSVPGMGKVQEVYVANLMSELVSLFTQRERTEAEKLNDTGFEHHHAGGYEEALRLHNQAIEIAPDFPLAWVNKGIALKNLDRLNEAIQCYDRVIDELDRGFKKAWYNKGVALMLKGDSGSARTCFEQALEIDPQYTLAQQMREQCLAEAKEVSSARLAAHAPTDPQAIRLLAMGANLASRGSWDAAARTFEQVLSLDPGNAMALTALGEMLCEVGRFTEAQSKLEQALEKDNQIGTAWLNLVRCYAERREFEPALEAAENAVKYSPDDSMAWSNRATALYGLERYEEALESARRSMELDSRNPFGLIYVGFSLFFLERYEEAREALERLVDIAPTFQGVPVAKEMLSEIRRLLE
jgi:tetratricopeptide (TPR) repeat protein